MIDGPTLLAEALDAGVAVDEVVAEPGGRRALLERAGGAGAVVRPVPATACSPGSSTP